MAYTLKLAACGNPDYYQSEDIGVAPKTVEVGSFIEARRAAEQYRDQNCLGGGNWKQADVLLDGKLVAKISYNGRLWGPDGKELHAGR